MFFLDEGMSISEGDSAGPSADELIEGEYVIFGRYPQNNGNTPEPIEWRVLDNDGETALLISRYGLDCKPFHKEYKEFAEIGWDKCDLRKWLNGEFLRKAFSISEQRRIAESDIYTGGNPKFGTEGCGETRDKVFCLSCDEAEKYFDSDDKDGDGNIVNYDRACEPTDYAVGQGAFKEEEEEDEDDPEYGNCWFWLRSPGFADGWAASVLYFGAVCDSGCCVRDNDAAVRPALRIIL